MTRGWLPRRAGLPSLTGGIAVPPKRLWKSLLCV